MTLREKQSLFTKLIGKLIDYAFSLPGVALTFGESYNHARTGHMPNSLHYIRLAQDFNLFIDGTYIMDGDHPTWKVLGEYWESLDPICRWGGRFNDANHFSLEHDGRK